MDRRRLLALLTAAPCLALKASHATNRSAERSKGRSDDRADEADCPDPRNPRCPEPDRADERRPPLRGIPRDARPDGGRNVSPGPHGPGGGPYD